MIMVGRWQSPTGYCNLTTRVPAGAWDCALAAMPERGCAEQRGAGAPRVLHNLITRPHDEGDSARNAF